MGDRRTTAGSRTADGAHTRDGPDDVGVLDERLRRMFAGAPHGIAITDLEGRYVHVNPAFCRLVGRPAETLIGTSWETTTHEEDHAQQRRAIARLLDGQPSEPFTKRYRRPDGSTAWARLTSSAACDLDGRPSNLIAFVEDITAAVEAEADRERDRALTRLAGRVARLGGWAVDLTSGVRSWTEEVFTILDHPEPTIATCDPASADDALDLYHPEDRPGLEAAFAECVATGRPFDLELRIRTFPGRQLWVRVAGELERDARGEPRRVVGAVQDVTERVAERASADALRRRLTHTVEQMDEGLVLLDAEERITFLNPHAERLLGLQGGQATGRHAWDPDLALIGTPLQSRVREAVRTATSVIAHAELDAVRDRWLSLHVHPSGAGVAIYLRDVTAERAAAVALQERGRQLTEQAALLDEAQDAIYVCDLDDRITFWNRGAAALYGWSPHEAIGRTVGELVRPDPQRFDDGRRTLWTEDRWSGETVNRHRDGRQLTLETRWTVVRDDRGRATSVLTLETDVSERRHHEQQALRAQRMASLGTLASGIAHDLNNVLSPILLSVQLLLAEETGDRSSEILRTIETSAHRGAEMVTQVLSFARGVEGQRVPVDVARLLDDVHRMARDTFPKHLSIDHHAPVDALTVEGDPTQLHQVLMNLAVNARDAMREASTGRLTLRAVPWQPTSAAAARLDLPGGSYVRIEVADDGPGMPPEVLDRVFEPFFTTKAQGDGTGLGLSISRAIVASHGGSIDVSSAPGRGTRFAVVLPTARAQRVAARPAPTDPPPAGTGERILLVDDEPQVRVAARWTLQQAGYRVVEATDGAEAIARFDDDADGFDLLITDLLMPGADGTATIRALQRRDPHLPIVASSGLHDELLDREVVPFGTAAQLPKPYTADQLLHTVRQALDVEPS